MKSIIEPTDASNAKEECSRIVEPIQRGAARIGKEDQEVANLVVEDIQQLAQWTEHSRVFHLRATKFQERTRIRPKERQIASATGTRSESGTENWSTLGSIDRARRFNRENKCTTITARTCSIAELVLRKNRCGRREPLSRENPCSQDRQLLQKFGRTRRRYKEIERQVANDSGTCLKNERVDSTNTSDLKLISFLICTFLNPNPPSILMLTSSNSLLIC